jgi:hypothetical protein
MLEICADLGSSMPIAPLRLFGHAAPEKRGVIRAEFARCALRPEDSLSRL